MVRGAEKSNGEWTTVSHRKNRSNPDLVRDISVTFYVTNIPEGVNAKDVWKASEKFGTIVDAYVANRRGKNGALFGFLRFIQVSDEKEMENKLNSILIQDRRLSINVARYKRNATKVMKENITKKGFVRNDPGKLLNSNNQWNTMGHGRSYADVLKNSRSNHGMFEHCRLPDRVKTIRLSDNAEANNYIGACTDTLMGEAKNIQVLDNIMELLNAEGLNMDCKVQYIRGLHLILKFDASYLAKTFLFDHRSTWEKWFSIYNCIKKSLLIQRKSFGLTYVACHHISGQNLTYLVFLPNKVKFLPPPEKYLHFGTRTSSRVEGAHAKLKQYLQVSTGDFQEVKDKICLAVEHEFNEIKVTLASITAPCTGYFTASMGLPCAHKMQYYVEHRMTLSLDLIHRHWRFDSLSLDSKDDYQGDDTILKLLKEFYSKYQLWPLNKKEFAVSMISNFVNESETFFEPLIRRPKGRPPKAKKKKRNNFH